MPSAPVVISRITPIAAALRRRLPAGRWHKAVSHRAVLVLGRHPLHNMLVQLAPTDAALAAQALAAHAQCRQVLLLLASRWWYWRVVDSHSSHGLVAGVITRRQCRQRGRGRGVRGAVPRPLQLVRPVAAHAQRHGAVQAAVDGVEVLAGEAQAGGVDGVQEVEDGEVHLGRQRGECEACAGSCAPLPGEEDWFVVHHGVGAAWLA